MLVIKTGAVGSPDSQLCFDQCDPREKGNMVSFPNLWAKFELYRDSGGSRGNKKSPA